MPTPATSVPRQPFAPLLSAEELQALLFCHEAEASTPALGCAPRAEAGGLWLDIGAVPTVL